MKKESLIIFPLIFLLLLPIVSGVDISLSKETYAPGETLQAKITGNFLSLTRSNIKLYEGDAFKSTPLLSEVTNQDGIYYFYATLPLKTGNFSLKIENSEYIQQGKLKTETIIKSFVMTETNQSVISVRPGFIVTEDDFSLTVKSVQGNNDITLLINSTGKREEFFLQEETEKKVKISIKDIQQSTTIFINDIKIPIFKVGKKINPRLGKIVFLPTEVTATVRPGETYFFNLILENNNRNVSNLQFSSSFESSILPTKIEQFNVGDGTSINVSIPIAENAEGNLTGEVTLEYENETIVLPIFLLITTDPKTINLTGTSFTESASCSSIGIQCNYDSNEVCQGETTASLEGPCCIGACIVQKESNLSFYIGLILLGIIILTIFIVIIRARRKRKRMSSTEAFKDKAQKYKKRMSGDGDEVSGKLGRH